MAAGRKCASDVSFSCGKRDVLEFVPFRGRYVPLLWQVPGEPITSGWEVLLPDHGSRTQVLGPKQGN